MKRIRGKSGFGKSSLLASVFVQLLHLGQTAVLIDPHTDLAQSIVGILVDTGFFGDPSAFSRLLYIDWSRRDRIVPFNVLSQPQLGVERAHHDVELGERRWVHVLDAVRRQVHLDRPQDPPTVSREVLRYRMKKYAITPPNR